MILKTMGIMALIIISLFLGSLIKGCGKEEIIEEHIEYEEPEVINIPSAKQELEKIRALEKWKEVPDIIIVKLGDNATYINELERLKEMKRKQIEGCIYYYLENTSNADCWKECCEGICRISEFCTINETEMMK